MEEFYKKNSKIYKKNRVIINCKRIKILQRIASEIRWIGKRKKKEKKEIYVDGRILQKEFKNLQKESCNNKLQKNQNFIENRVNRVR